MMKPYSSKLIHCLLKLGKNAVPNYYDGLKWLWAQDVSYTTAYVDFKAYIYKFIDPLFETYFNDRAEQSSIRLDEVVWGGVYQDGIPPLRYPKLIPAKEANYLDSDHVVFGVYHNGVAKAYPKRILAWHEMFIDEFAGEEVAGVYCTLCGTVIPYFTKHNGQQHDLGTSGFLYRSNKLMYDRATQSLWNTLEGKPVVGPLIVQNIQLNILPIVTTSWKEWKESHPTTLVLDIETGHERDYREGAAYKNYFGSDELMFPVPLKSSLLNNKDEVFVIRLKGYEDSPIAFDKNFLRQQCIYQGQLKDKSYLIVVSPNGAVRAYVNKGYHFHCPSIGQIKDGEGRTWKQSEEALIGPKGESLERIPGHSSFWFAWYNMFPKTELIK